MALFVFGACRDRFSLISQFRLETDLSPSKNLDIKEALAALKTRGSSKPSTPTSTVPSISLPGERLSTSAKRQDAGCS